MKNVCFFNSEKKWGGGEKWHLKMAVLFTKHNYNVTLVGSACGELAERAAKEHINVKKISIKKHSYFNPVTLYKIYRIFKEKKIDTLFMNSSQDLKLCSLPAKFAGVKNIVYRRGMPHPIKNTFLNRIIFSKVLTHLIVNSKEIEKSIFTNNNKMISKDKVILLYNGIDENDYQNTKEKLYEKENSEVIFGNSGRLVEQKGQNYLINAAKILKDKGYDFKILIAGKGKLEEQLKQEIIRYNLEKQVILLGFVKNVEIFMNSIDVFVFPSHFEGSANAIVEAMYFSKPIVCFDVSSMPELVKNEENGYLAEYKNIEDFTEKMEKYIKNTELIKKMGDKSKEMSKEFDITEIFKRLEKKLT